MINSFFSVALPPELPVTQTCVNMTDILTLLVIHILMCMVQMIYKDCLLPYAASHHLEPVSPSAGHVPAAVTARISSPLEMWTSLRSDTKLRLA